jgi:YVTN family beta-propeller protein
MNKLSALLCKILFVFAVSFGSSQASFSQAGTHLHFDGMSDYVNVPHSSSLKIVGDVTNELWFKLSTLQNAHLITFSGAGETEAVNVLYQIAITNVSGSNARFQFFAETGDGVNIDLSSPTVTLNTGIWYHIAVTRSISADNQTVKFYLDGTQIGTNQTSASLPSGGAASYLRIGSNSVNSSVFSGSIDEVRIWNTSLSSDDISRRKNCELQGNEAGLVAYYKFNQGIAAGTNTTVTSLTDATTNANTGTLTNFALTGNTSNWLASLPIVTTGSTIPTAPTAAAQSFCDSAKVNNLSPAASTTIKWYNVATGGTALATTTALATGTYYVTAVNANGCESVRTSVAVTINLSPVVNAISNQTVCNGTATTAVNFAGTADSYTWTNDNASIGLAASGTGNITSFTATNTGSTALTATITVTPKKAPLAYIANHLSDNVSVINTATNTVTATVNVGSYPLGVSVSPDGTKVYVANIASNNVSVINTATNTVTATVTMGGGPFGLSVNPDGTKVYVANQGSGTVSVINTATNTLANTITVGTSPAGVSVSPDGTKVYVANHLSDNVSVINTANNTVVATVGVGSYPYGVSVSPDGTKVYVANSGSDSVSVINTANNTVVATVGVGSYPIGVSVSPDGTKVYVANAGSNNVSVINAATYTVVATVTVGSQPYGVSLSPDGTKVYVTNQGSDNVSVLNTATNTVVASINVDSYPLSLGNFITATPLCNTGAAKTFTITVNPTATVNTVTNQVVCNNAATTAVTFSSPTTGGTIVYNWINNTPSIGLAASGVGNIPTFNGTNTTTAPVTATITVTPSYTNAGVTCVGTARTFTITVNPTATVNTITNQVICNASPTTAVTFTSPTSGGTIIYNWTNNTTSIGLAASGSGNIASFNATNTTTAPITATITVTPTFTNGGVSCTGTPNTYTYTVNPTATVNAITSQVVCNNSPTTAVTFATTATGGTIVYNWSNNTPSIGLAASGSGNIPSFTATNTTTAPVTATITVTPSYTNAGVTCVGTARTFTITVNPTATVNAITNQVICNNAATTAVNFTSPTTGGTIVYNWANNTTSIGLAASGSGNIASFTAINTGTAPVVATITVTPTYTGSGNNALMFNGNNNIAVTTPSNIPSVNSPYTLEAWVKPNSILGADGIVGWGNYGTFNQVNALRFNGPTQLINYWWGNDLVVNIPNVMDGNWHHIVATFNGTTRAIYMDGVLRGSDTPTGHNVTITNNLTIAKTCPFCGSGEFFNGAMDEVRIWNVGRTQAQILATMNATIPVNTPGLAAYYRMDEGIGATTTDNTGNGNNGTLISNPTWIVPSTSPAANFSACIGTPVTYTYTVNPTATVNAVANQVVCSGSATTAVNFGANVTGGTIVYNWTNSASGIGLAATGTGNIPSFTATNTTQAPIVATISVTASFTNGSVTCTGPAQTFTYTVNPTPIVTLAPFAAICKNAAAINLSGGLPLVTAGTTGIYTVNGVVQTTFNPANYTPGLHTIVYTYTNIYGCVSSATQQIRVHPIHVVEITVAPNSGVAPGSAVTVVATVSPVDNYTYAWSKNNVLIPAPNADRISVLANDAGNYKVAVTAPTGCVVVSNSAFTASANVPQTLFIFPNPNTGIFNVAYNNGGANLTARTLNVYDGKGAVVFSQSYSINVPFGNMKVDISKYAKGQYYVILTDSSGKKLASATVQKL